MKYNFDISIIIPTIENPIKLKKLLELIDNQNYLLKKKIELIIVHQCKSRKKLKLKFKNITNIHVINEKKKSLSRAKNLGIKYSKGFLISILDDDVLVNKDYLKQIFNFFKKNKNIDILFGAIKIINSQQFYSRYMSQNKTKVNFINLKKCLASAMIFKNKKKLRFDERFGLGAKYPSSEETDFIFNSLINQKSKIIYNPKICLYHPNDELLNKDTVSIKKKFFSYGIGAGAVYAKYLKNNYFFFILYLFELFKSLVGLSIGILKFNKFLVLKHLSLLNGKFFGFIRFYY